MRRLMLGHAGRAISWFALSRPRIEKGDGNYRSRKSANGKIWSRMCHAGFILVAKKPTKVFGLENLEVAKLVEKV